MEESDGGECAPYASTFNKIRVKVNYFYLQDSLVENVN